MASELAFDCCQESNNKPCDAFEDIRDSRVGEKHVLVVGHQQ
jgi:hypothetical protein